MPVQIGDIQGFFISVRAEMIRYLRAELKIVPQTPLPTNLQAIITTEITAKLPQMVDTMITNKIDEIIEREKSDPNILKEKADLLFARKKAYVTASFTDLEAMDVLKSEMSVK